jgi:hypothetical protein
MEFIIGPMSNYRWRREEKHNRDRSLPFQPALIQVSIPTAPGFS